MSYQLIPINPEPEYPKGIRRVNEIKTDHGIPLRFTFPNGEESNLVFEVSYHLPQFGAYTWWWLKEYLNRRAPQIDLPTSCDGDELPSRHCLTIYNLIQDGLDPFPEGIDDTLNGRHRKWYLKGIDTGQVQMRLTKPDGSRGDWVKPTESFLMETKLIGNQTDTITYLNEIKDCFKLSGGFYVQ